MDITRSYTPADRAACLKLFDSNCPRFFDPSERADFEAFLDAIDWPYQVIERAGRIVACGGYQIEADGRTACLCWGMVDAALQGQGVGAALTQARLAAARAHPDVKAIRLDTTQRTRGFYERFGFRTERMTPDGYAPGYDRYDMVLKL